MDYKVSSQTLDIFSELIDDLMKEYIKELHSKYLEDMDIQELYNVYDGIKKKKYKIKIENKKNKV
tara:strand:- start:515 stop:709 length:195 start_codon:yes stop_codon:yes gene_type:complete